MSHFDPTPITADETNVVVMDLLNASSNSQTVDGSSTSVSFSYAPPSGYKFLCSKIIIYMEGATAFNSNKFGDQTALTTGWQLAINGTVAMTAKQNRALAQYMYDMRGVAIFGKEDRTMVGRFCFNDIANGSDGLTIRDGENISTIVNDDLTGLTYLEAKVSGILLPV